MANGNRLWFYCMHYLIVVMSVRRDCIRKDNARTETSDCERIPEKEKHCRDDCIILDNYSDVRVMELTMLPV